GWSVQKPIQRASQRNEAAIEAWRTERWPALKRRPQSTLSAMGFGNRRDAGLLGRGDRGQPDACPRQPGLVS
ncbi:MAG: winged helix-turn-helix domain-containing protein, partial [Actinomycetes bacterium]